MMLLTLAICLLTLVGVWLAVETRRVHQALDRYALEVRLWNDMLHRLGEHPYHEEEL